MNHEERTKAYRTPACSMSTVLWQWQTCCARLSDSNSTFASTGDKKRVKTRTGRQTAKVRVEKHRPQKVPQALCIWNAVNHMSLFRRCSSNSTYLSLTSRENAPPKASRSWQSSLRCWRRISRLATTTAPLRSPPPTFLFLLSSLQRVIEGDQIHVYVTSWSITLTNMLTAFTTIPHTPPPRLLTKVQGTTATSLMRWSRAPSPTSPTHQAPQSTTRPCPLLASCTTASSSPTLREMEEEGRSGLILRTMTGTCTDLFTSGHSCRKRRASWGTSLTLCCWPAMDMARREFGAVNPKPFSLPQVMSLESLAVGA